MKLLEGKVALVTGAARGIGKAIALKYAQEGANVAFTDLVIDENGENTKKEIEAYGVKVLAIASNAANFEEAHAAVEQVVKEFGRLDILVNNAGITRDNLLVTMDEEDFDAVINTNLKGCYNMIKACGRNFIRKKQGRIINISSVSALMGIAGQVNYSSSKAGVIALTKVVAREFGGKNVCCNAIAPGFITTDMTKDLNADDEYIKNIPLKRLGNPDDVANLAAFLASDLSGYITGEVIRIDGGLAM